MLVKAMGVGNDARSMQPLMYDEPQPTCGRIENNSAERDGADHHTPKKDRLSKPPVWIGRKHCPFLLRESYRPNPFKLASRPALGVFDFTRWGVAALRPGSSSNTDANACPSLFRTSKFATCSCHFALP